MPPAYLLHVVTRSRLASHVLGQVQQLLMWIAVGRHSPPPPSSAAELSLSARPPPPNLSDHCTLSFTASFCLAGLGTDGGDDRLFTNWRPLHGYQARAVVIATKHDADHRLGVVLQLQPVAPLQLQAEPEWPQFRSCPLTLRFSVRHFDGNAMEYRLMTQHDRKEFSRTTSTIGDNDILRCPLAEAAASNRKWTAAGEPDGTVMFRFEVELVA